MPHPDTTHPATPPDPPRHEQEGEEEAQAEILEALRWGGCELNNHGMFLPSSDGESDGALFTSRAGDLEAHTSSSSPNKRGGGATLRSRDTNPRQSPTHASEARAPQESNVAHTARARPRNDSESTVICTERDDTQTASTDPHPTGATIPASNRGNGPV